MTVVVGILNKRGVSIAADSATTHAVTHQLPNGDEVVDEYKITPKATINVEALKKQLAAYKKDFDRIKKEETYK